MRIDKSSGGQLCRFDATGYRGQDLRPKPAAIHIMAARAADHYQALHARALESADTAVTGLPVTIHVHPVLKSGRGHSADFRHWLSAHLTRGTVTGRYFDNRIETTRDRLECERLLSSFGFRFVEVKPGESS